ncbi:cathelicidin-5-like [Muntiacus reevesi]|uniref:cathelicidin-5-like n=1 Tax=Muntiacus reevesi TaxID=9886 RepID=UPI0033072F02
METQRASLSLGRWALWLLLLGLVLPSVRAQSYSYRRAVLRAVDQFNEQSSEANLYRLLELYPPPEENAALTSLSPSVGRRCPQRCRVIRSCSLTSQQPLEQCDFKENGLLKECVGTITLDQAESNFDITCAVGRERPSCPGPSLP